MTEIIPSIARRPWLARRIGAALLAGTALAGLSVAPVLAAPEPAAQQVPVGPGNPPPQGQPPVNQGQAMPERLPSFVNLVKQVRPAVVSVTNYLKSTAAMEEDGPRAPQLPFPFNQFPFSQQTPHARAVEARGSGFIVNPDGLIITNNHVVKDARRVEVTLATGEKLTAKVVGTDPRTDIAVLKVELAQAAAVPAAWQLQGRAARPVGHRHWQPVRPVGICVGRHRLRGGAHHRRWAV